MPTDPLSPATDLYQLHPTIPQLHKKLTSFTSLNTLNLSSPISLLVRLPGEIRNRIYELVLHHETHGLRYLGPSLPMPSLTRRPVLMHKNDFFKITPAVACDFNRLKYCCRQLYQETAGLEVKVNNIWFVGKNVQGQSALIQFLGFVRICTPKKLAWLKTVVLATRPTFYWRSALHDRYHKVIMEEIVQVGTFCKSNPNITVRVLLPYFTYTRTDVVEFMMAGARVNKIIRNDDMGVLLTDKGVAAVNIIHPLRMGNEYDIDLWQAPNLRIFPTEPSFDEQEFLAKAEVYQARVGPYERSMSYLVKDLDIWVRLARDWVEKGI